MFATLAILAAGVTFRETASLERLLKDLSAQTGQAMHASGKVKDEVLLVDVHQQPLESVCDLIAKASDAEWDRSRKDWRLERSAALERKLDARERQQKLNEWRKAQAKMRDELAKEPAFDEVAAGALRTDYDAWYRKYPDYGALTNEQHNAAFGAWQAMMKRAPGNRALQSLIVNFDFSSILDLRDGSRIVFAEPPHRMQASLKAADPSFAKNLETMLAVWRTVAERRGTPKREWIYSGDPTVDRNTEKGRRLVVLTSRSNGRELIFRLWQYDETGENLRESIDWLASDELDLPSPSERDEKPFVGDASTEEFLKQFRTGLTAENREKVSHPDISEPLGWLLGPDLSEIARRRERDIVALLPDEVFPTAFFVRARKYFPARYLWVLETQGLRFSDDGRTIVGTSSCPLKVQTSRSSRTDLRALIDAAAREGRVSLDSLAAFVTRNPMAGYADVGYYACEASTPGSTRGQNNLDARLLRLYGSLENNQRRTLTGEGIRFEALSVAQRAMVEDLVFFAERPPQMTMGEMASGPRVRGRQTILDSTELLPEGLPSNGRLRVAVGRELTVMSVTKANGRDYTSVNDLRDLVQEALIPSNVGGWPAYRDRRPLWATTYRKQYRFEFLMTPDVSFMRTLTDVSLPNVKDAVPYEQLPADVRKEIETAMSAEMKKRQELGGIGRKPPP